jgi:hypothetical protein
MSTTTERTALLHVAERIDRKAIDAAQKQEHKTLRLNATTERKELEQERKAEMKNIRNLFRVTKEHFDARRKDIANQLKSFIAEKDAEIVSEFATRREAQADKHVLAITIADHDQNNSQSQN